MKQYGVPLWYQVLALLCLIEKHDYKKMNLTIGSFHFEYFAYLLI